MPKAKVAQRQVYDSARSRVAQVVLYGGGPDMWEWNGTTWTEVTL